MANKKGPKLPAQQLAILGTKHTYYLYYLPLPFFYSVPCRVFVFVSCCQDIATLTCARPSIKSTCLRPTPQHQTKDP
jgi:hypothetical protein